MATIIGTESADILLGGLEDDLITGLEGDDALYGLEGADSLAGGEGIDFLVGGDGDDTLAGDQGDDFLNGGLGDDTYIVGSGADIIEEFDEAPASNDAVQFLSLSSTDLTGLLRIGDNLVFQFGVVGSLTVRNHFFSDVFRIEQFSFGDAVTWDDAAIKARVVTLGSELAEAIFGYDDGANRIFGLGGNDNLHGGSQADLLDGGDGNDGLYGFNGDDSLIGGDGVDALHGENGADTLTGGQGDDFLLAGSGADRLIGGLGADYLEGGTGDDIYIVGAGMGADALLDFDATPGNHDLIEFQDIASTDLTGLLRIGEDLLFQYGDGDSLSVTNYFLATFAYRIEQFSFSDGFNWNDASVKARLTTLGGAGNDNLTGFADSTNRIFGLAGDDYLQGGALADMLDGGSGNDHLVGLWGNDSLIGGEGNDTLDGDLGADTLDGGQGEDSLFGGQGGDTYIVGIGTGVDRIVENDPTPNVTDVVLFQSMASTDLTGLLRKGDDLVFQYGAGDSLGVVNYFHREAHRIEQFSFSDATWNDAAIKARVLTQGSDVNDTLLGYFDGENRLFGFGGNDFLQGNLQADLLDGGRGNDTLYGLSGNDTYIVGIGMGKDTLLDFDPTPGNIDVVRFTDVDSTALKAVLRKGDSLVFQYGVGDSLTVGNYFNEFIGIESRVEQFVFSDLVTWDAATVNAKVITPGSAGDDVLIGLDDSTNRIFGYAGNDILQGGSLADVLNGGAGADTMQGGLGADTYILDNVGDVVIEEADAGVDRINVSFDYTLAENFEILFFTGTDNLVGVGNDHDNRLVGNAGNNSLTGGLGNDTMNGGLGIDTMQGGLGDDAYVVDNLADVIIENAGEGVDKVNALISYTLGETFETLVLIGTDNIDGVGNDLNNAVIGNIGNNNLSGGLGNDYLKGGLGLDTMAGGLGNDTYRVDDAGDVVIENAGEGTDRVNAAFSYTLLDNFENLVLTGIGNLDSMENLNGTGNSANNSLIGNSGNNSLDGGLGNDVLSGGAGADILIGGLGNDRLTGGADADQFVFNTTPGVGNVDTITDFLSGTDSIVLDGAVFTGFGGALTVDMFISGAGLTAAADANDHLIYNTGNGGLFYDADGIGGVAAVRIANLSGAPVLGFTDFSIA